jgi:hypothetical protein
MKLPNTSKGWLKQYDYTRGGSGVGLPAILNERYRLVYVSYVQESTEVTGNHVRACLRSVYEPEACWDHFCCGSEHRSSRYSSAGSTSRAFSHGPNCPSLPIRSGLLVPRSFRFHLALRRTAIPVTRWRDRLTSNNPQHSILVWGFCDDAGTSAQERKPSIAGVTSRLRSLTMPGILSLERWFRQLVYGLPMNNPTK